LDASDLSRGLLARNGVAAVTAAISPYADARDDVRRLAALDGTPFVEVHVDAVDRDTRDARCQRFVQESAGGEVASFTGVSDPYEPPHQPDLVINTDCEAIDDSVESILAVLAERHLVPEDVCVASASAHA